MYASLGNYARLVLYKTGKNHDYLEILVGDSLFFSQSLISISFLYGPHELLSNMLSIFLNIFHYFSILFKLLQKIF